MLEDGLITLQGMTRPVGAEQVEHPMLNRIPFGRTRRVMRHRNLQAKLIGQRLEVDFPRQAAVAVRPATIGFDQQVALRRIGVTPHCPPFDPVGSRSTPVGVQRIRAELTVL